MNDLVLLASHFDRINHAKLWMKARTYKKPRYIPAHDIKALFHKIYTKITNTFSYINMIRYNVIHNPVYKHISMEYSYMSPSSDWKYR